MTRPRTTGPILYAQLPIENAFKHGKIWHLFDIITTCRTSHLRAQHGVVTRVHCIGKCPRFPPRWSSLLCFWDTNFRCFFFLFLVFIIFCGSPMSWTRRKINLGFTENDNAGRPNWWNKIDESHDSHPWQRGTY